MNRYRYWLVGLVLPLALVTVGCTDSHGVIGDLPSSSILAGQPSPSSAQPAAPARQAAPSAARPASPALAGSGYYRRASYDRSAGAGASGWMPSAYDRPWRYIVIHHSSTDVGSSEIFDAAHRARGWDEMGYHFVIDNGRGGGNGQVEVGGRWTKQKWGAHTGNTPGNEYNNYGIGICIVGNFTNHTPSAAQQASLRKLVFFLSDRYGIDPAHIVGHRDAPNADTECPGDALYRYIYSDLRPAVSAHKRGLQ